MPKEARCPRCNRKVQWSWCADVFMILNGSEYYPATRILHRNKHRELQEQSCLCGVLLGMAVCTDDGELMYNHPSFSAIDWALETNSYMSGKEV